MKIAELVKAGSIGLKGYHIALLIALMEKKYDEIIQLFIDYSFDINQELKVLEQMGYVKIGGESIEDVCLRHSALELFDDSIHSISWIEDWLLLFPEGVKSGGYYIRSDEKECADKMVKFIKKYKYDKDTIFKATKNYIERMKKQNYNFITLATYFITKRDRGSILASECANLNSKENNMEINEML
jgi:hypothetical protein